MNAENGVQFLIALITREYITLEDLKKAIEIAATKSPSAAFRRASEYCVLAGKREYYLAFAKGTRWLAMLRRDQGQQAFEAEVAKLRAQAKVAAGQVEWRLADGTPVRDRQDSHLASHAEEYPELLSLLPLALAKINPQGRGFIAEEVDMGRVIGESILVETGPSDAIVFAQRPNRQGLTRFVKNRQPEPCNYITVLLEKAGKGNFYTLLTAYVGRRTPDEPWSPFARPDSVQFWSTHALIWGASPILPGTETTVCPW